MLSRELLSLPSPVSLLDTPLSMPDYQLLVRNGGLEGAIPYGQRPPSSPPVSLSESVKQVIFPPQS